MNIHYLQGCSFQKSNREFAQTTTFPRLKDYLRRNFHRFRKYRELRKAQRIDRLAFQHVLYLDDQLLEEIGVTRYDVLWANKLPLKENAALELRNIARTKCHAVHRRPLKKYWL